MENEKKMSLVDLTFMGIGGCIGAGIYSMLGVGIGYTGRSVALAFAIAMIFKMSQQIRSIVMASMFSLSGGLYSQQALILTPTLTGVTALNNVVSAFSFSVFGLSLASYTVVLFPGLASVEKILAAGFLVLFFVTAASGVNVFAKVQNLLGTSKIVALLMFVAFALMARGDYAASYAGEPFFYNGTGSFVMAIAMMSFTCDGINSIINFAPQAQNAKKDIPKAWLLGSLICGGIYVLLGLAGSGLGSYAEVANVNIGVLAQKVLPGPLYIFFIVGGAMASLSTALLGGVAGFGNMIVGIAQDGWLPKMFLNKTKVYIVLCAGAVLPILGGFTLDNIVSMVMIPSSILALLTDLRAMKLPDRFPEEWEKSDLKMSKGLFKGLMCLSIVASSLTASFSFMSLTGSLAVGIVAITVFIFAYSAYLVKAGKANITSTQDLG